EAAYLRVIERKTAVLFAAGTRLGALASNADAATQQALYDYGMALGYAFQIADDVLDYTADAATMGKNLGDDLAEGKATLPLIHALTRSDEATRERLRQIVQEGDTSAMDEVLAAIHATGGLEYSRRRAMEYADAADAALAGLPESEALDALRGLARYAVDRTHSHHRPHRGPCFPISKMPPRRRRSGNAETRDGADAVRIEAGQLGEVAAALGVVAVGAEARRARRQQHHAASAQQPLRACHRIGQVVGRLQREQALGRLRLQQCMDARTVGAHGHHRL